MQYKNKTRLNLLNFITVLSFVLDIKNSMVAERKYMCSPPLNKVRHSDQGAPTHGFGRLPAEVGLKLLVLVEARLQLPELPFGARQVRLPLLQVRLQSGQTHMDFISHSFFNE